MIKTWLAILKGVWIGLTSGKADAEYWRRRLAAFRRYKLVHPVVPKYQGRNLHRWLKVFFLKDGAERDAALEAVHQMGAAVIPHLVALVQFGSLKEIDFFLLRLKASTVEMKRFKEESRREDKEHQRIMDLIHESHRTGTRVEIRPAERSLKPGYSDHRYEFGLAMLFRTLRQEAKPAVPELAALLHQPQDFFNVSEAASALVGIGREGMGPLLTALHHEKDHVRSSVLRTLQFLDSEFETVLPAVLRCFNDPDSHVRSSAVRTLHSHLDARRIPCTDEILRGLIDRLSDSDETVQLASIVAFTQLVQAGVGSKAEAAIPALQRSASAGSDLVQRTASLALYSMEHPL